MSEVVVEQLLRCRLKPPSRLWGEGAILLLVLVAALAGRLCYLAEKFDGDAATFAYLGRVTSEGGVVGREVIDNKLPTVGLVMTLPWRAFGLSWSAYVVSGACLSIGAALLLSRAAATNFGDSSRVPALLFGLVAFNFTDAVYAGFQLETPQMFFAVCAAACAMAVLRRGSLGNSFAAGLFAGIAAMFKPSGLAVELALIIALLITARSRSRRATVQLVLATLAGTLLIFAAVTVWLVHLHAIESTLELARQIQRYASSSAHDRSSDAIKLIIVAGVLGFPVLIRGWIFRRARIAEVRIGASLKWFAVLWAAFETIGVLLQGRMYAYHFLVLAAPAALIFAMLPRREHRLATVAALAPLIVWSACSAGRVINDANHTDRWPARLAISDYLAQHTTTSDAIWIDDAPRVLLETRCRAGSVVPSTFLFANDDNAPAKFSSRLISDFEITKPKYIVLPTNREASVSAQMQSVLEFSENPARERAARNAWNTLFDYVDQRYVLESRVGAESVFQRNDR